DFSTRRIKSATILCFAGRTKSKDRKCPKRCKSNDSSLTQVDYCLRPWAIRAQVLSIRRQRRWMQVSARIFPYRCPTRSCPTSPSATFWIKRRHWRCRCPRLRRGATYLVMTRDKHHRKHPDDLVLDKRSIVLRWQDSQLNQLRQFERFVGYDYTADGCVDCDCIRRRHRQQRRRRHQRRRGSSGGRKASSRMRKRDSRSAPLPPPPPLPEPPTELPLLPLFRRQSHRGRPTFTAAQRTEHRGRSGLRKVEN
ncbi:hypothetical protein BOX15_Mlig014115g1, partial [Macrostomum lignano]